MTYNLYIIKDLLENYLHHTLAISHLTSDRLSCPIKNVLISHNGYLSMPADWLRIISAQDWKEQRISEGHFYLIWNWDSECKKRTDCEYLGFQHLVSANALLFAVQKLFEELQQWELALYDIAAQNGNMEEMGKISLKFIDNPVCLYTASLQNIFICERPKPRQLMFFQPEDLHNYLSAEEIEGLRFNPDFLKTLDTTVPDIFPDEFWGYRILYDNIRKEGIYIARLMACEIDRPIRDADYCLLRKLANIMKYAIEKENWAINGHVAFIDDYITNLIHGTYVDSSKLSSALQFMNWKMQDEFFCVKIPLSAEDEKINTMAALCAKLETSIPGCLAILGNKYILLLFNLTYSKNNREQIVSFMISILREYVLHAGISMPFSGIEAIQSYYLQAHYALEIGEKEDPTIWYYRYEHYEYSHILENLTGDMDLEALYPIGLKKLLRYDKEHNREYTFALKTYLEQNMSVTATIRQLYIQKSTFIYQLKRIHDITNVNFEDTQTRMLYSMIFQIMEKRGLI